MDAKVVFFGKTVPDWIVRALSIPFVYSLGIAILLTIMFLLKVFNYRLPG